jgi:UDP-glucuronate 4-epimerase
MYILITGVAGFVGFNFANELIKKKYKVIGIDNLNSYYSKKLKLERIKILSQNKNFRFLKIDLIYTDSILN